MRARRLSSRMAFHGLAEPAARKLLARDYGSVLAGASANPAATIESEGTVVRYLSDYSAQVRTPEGLQVETSSVPLRVPSRTGAEQPVALGLQRDATGFAPSAPLKAVSIGESAGEGVTLNSRGVALRMLGADSPGRLVDEHNVFFGEVDTDTDAVATPKLDGVDLSALLRTRLSPDQLRYRVAMPLGARLRAKDGGAVVERGDSILARIPAPSARDAQGTAVPVAMHVRGDELVLAINHREASYAYPILVDPEVLIEISETSAGWEFYAESLDPFYCEGLSGGGISFVGCGSSGPVGHSGPGNGAPVTATISGTAVPFVKSHYNPYQEREEEVEIHSFKGEQWWWPHSNITSVEFIGISASGASGPNVYTYFDLEACRQFHEWSAPETTEVSVRIASTPENGCNNSNMWALEPISVMVSSGTTLHWEQENPPFGKFIPGGQATVGGTISVDAVLVTRPLSSQEEEELNSEDYGNGNPAEMSNTDCMLGDPVNCATGNLVETQKDVSVGGSGPGLQMTRTYNSQMAVTEEEPGSFGFGWTGTYSDWVDLQERCIANCEIIVSRGEGKGEEGGEEEPEVIEEIAVVHQDNGSTAEFHRVIGEGSWTPANPMIRAKLATQGTELVYTLPDQNRFRFDASGLLSTEEDRNGNAVEVHRDGQQRVASVSDESGRELTFSYDAEGFVEVIEDPMGNAVHYGYEEGNLISVSQLGAMSPRWQFGYDIVHELNSVTDGRGATTTTKYQALRASRQKDPLGRETHWEYEQTETGETTTITEPNSSKTVEEFNEDGLLTSATHAAGTAIAATTTHEYNGSGGLIATTDPNEHTTEYGYDADGNRTSMVDPLGEETKWTYDEAHDVLSTTTPNGETTTIARDGHGNPETISRPAGKATQTTSYTYTSHGQPESMTDPLEHVWHYEYDSQGDRKAETDPEGDKRTWVYNEDSQVTSTVSPRGNEEGAKAAEYTTTIEHDAQGRKLKETDPLEHTTKYTYDGDGNVEAETDPNGHKTKYTYDADNELTKVEKPNGDVFETGYDGAGQVTSQTDGNKHTTTYVRNVLEEPIEVIDPLKRKTTEEYDAAGNLKATTDPSKRKTSYAYDAANRLKEVSYSEGGMSTVKFGYDKDGNRTSISDGTGESSYEYNQLGRIIHSKDGHGDTVGYEYNLGNEQTGITYPNGKSISRAFDNAGRLKSITDWLGHATAFAYNRDSEPKSTTFPTATGNLDEYAYDHADRISEVKMKKGAETLASLGYTRDKVGQIEKLISKGLPGAEEETFSYDENNRLTKAGAGSYEYDAANNPTKLPGSTNSYDEASELKAATDTTYTYDEEGERTKVTPSAAAGESPSYSSTFASPGTGAGQLERPRGLFRDPSGNLWVADTENNRIDEFSGAGAFIKAFGWGVSNGEAKLQVCTSSCQAGKAGTGNGQLSWPSAIAVDSKGNVWVADQANFRIQEFTESGEYIRQAGGTGTAGGQFSPYHGPEGIAIDSKGNVWASDTENRRIEEFNEKAEFIKTIGWGVSNGESKLQVCTTSCRSGLPGSGNGQFEIPEQIAIGAGNTVFVTDSNQNRVEVFNESGEFIRQFGSEGTGPGQFKNPYGIAIDSSGDVFVGDTVSNHRIEEFNESGEYVTRFGTQGTGPGQFTGGLDGIAVNSSGDLWVTTSGRVDRWLVGPISYLSTFASAGTGAGQLEGPRGLARDPAGHLWVADTENNRIDEFSEAGSFIKTIGWGVSNGEAKLQVCTSSCQTGKSGSGNGQLYWPSAIALDSKGNVWVADQANFRLQEFTESGEFIRKVGAAGTGNGQFSPYHGPEGVAIDSKGNIWASDTENRRIEEFTETGTFVKTIGWGVSNGESKLQVCTSSCRSGLPGSGNGQFEIPEQIAIGAGNTVFVTDSDSDRVQVLSESGEFVRQFGTEGSGPGQFKSPYGIAIDPSGDVFVSDTTANHRIDEFNEKGEYLRQFGSEGTGPGQFTSGLNGIATGSGGTFWVTESRGGVVQKWLLASQPTTYKYDQAGNLTAVERLKTGGIPTISETYTYDGTGLRASQTVSGTKSYFAWDQSEGLPLLLNDGSTNYIYGPGGLPLEQISSGEAPTYYHHDQLGSTRMLTDSSGKATATFTYGPYGALTGSTGTQATPLGYSGQYTNSQSGLQYLRARSYDPVTGQFLTRDPLTAFTGAPYNYAEDSPLNGVDPSGLSSWNPFSESFWTEGNFISESPLNPIPYYEREVEAWENGCSYWSSVSHGLEGAAVLTIDVAGGALPLADIPGGLAALDYWTEQFATRYPKLYVFLLNRAATTGTGPPVASTTLAFFLHWMEEHLSH